MAYSLNDLDTITQAIIDLGAGRRQVKVTIAGETMEYAPANLDALRSLRSEIQAELASTGDTDNRYCLLATGKGF